MKRTFKFIIPLLALVVVFALPALAQDGEGNILKNGGAEGNLLAYACGPTTSWEQSDDGGSFSGHRYFKYTGYDPTATLCQELPIPEVLWNAIDAGVLEFNFHVFIHAPYGGTASAPESVFPSAVGRVDLEYIDGSGGQLGIYSTGPYTGIGWSANTGPGGEVTPQFEDPWRIAPSGTRTIKLSMVSMSSGFPGSDPHFGAFDEAFLCVRAGGTSGGRINPVTNGQIAAAFLLNYNNPWEVPRRRASQPE